MFIQVVQGAVRDPAALRTRLDAWVRDLGPSATGWLGTTAGATADGEFVAVVRFADEPAARRNEIDPAQDAWWTDTGRLFEGGAVFRDYPHADMWLGGGSDAAGFVQVIQGRYTGVGTPADMAAEAEDVRELRPDVIGGTLGWDDGGHFTQTVYFTSQHEARAGERAMAAAMPEEAGQWMASVADLRFLDLTDPWMAGPGRA